MEWTDEMIRQCSKPVGNLGRTVAKEMNECHYDLWKWGLHHITINNNSDILDVGCGGGGAIKLLSKLSKDCKISGIDFSDDMVNLSREINKEAVKASTVEILKGNVSDIPYPGRSFDLVTAFETDYFWDDMRKALQDILRVLKEGGIFLIVDEAYLHELYEVRNKQWSELMGTDFYSPEEYDLLLSESGFSFTKIIEIPERNWITIISKKPSAMQD